MVFHTYFKIQKQFDITIILSFDNLAAVLATFPKIGHFLKFLATLVTRIDKVS